MKLSFNSSWHYPIPKERNNSRDVSFTLGMDDKAGVFKVPERLYGREVELEVLNQTYSQVVHTLDSSLQVSIQKITHDIVV